MSGCPICLESLDEQESLAMPQCAHRLHVRCALSAAQYDVRCPVCRATDPLVTPKVSDFDQTIQQIELLAQEHHAEVRRYRQRRARACCRRPSLRELREQSRVAAREFAQANRTLERAWHAKQRVLWREDAELLALRRERQRALARMTRTQRRLDAQLVPLVGEAP